MEEKPQKPRENDWVWVLMCLIGGGAINIFAQKAYMEFTGTQPYWLAVFLNGVWTLAFMLSLKRALRKPCTKCGNLIESRFFRFGTTKPKCTRCDS